MLSSNQCRARLEAHRPLWCDFSQADDRRDLSHTVEPNSRAYTHLLYVLMLTAWPRKSRSRTNDNMATVLSNNIASLKEVSLNQRSNKEKLAAKQLGPPIPNLKLLWRAGRRPGMSGNPGYLAAVWPKLCTASRAFCFTLDLVVTDMVWTTTGVQHTFNCCVTSNWSFIWTIV